MSGGGGGGTQNVTQTTLPAYARPYFTELMKQAGKNIYQTDASGAVIGIKPFQPYEGERLAGFNPLQQQTQAELAGMQTPGQFGMASQGAGAAGLMGFGAAQQGLGQAFGYQPGQFESGYKSMGYGPTGFNTMFAQAPELMQYQMNAPEKVRSQRAGSDVFTPGASSYYMSPYVEQAIAPQLREARLAGDVAQQRNMLGSIKGGTFGGSRQALLQAEQERGTQQNLSDIVGKGYQSAYENAQQQFERDQQRRMAAQQLNVQSGLQAALANQQAGLTAGQANLQALLGVQQLGSGQSMQAQLANQQAFMDAQRAAEQSRQFGATFGESSATRAAEFAMREQQAREQAGQYAAGLGKDIGLSGMQMGLAGSELMGRLGTSQQAADLERLRAQGAAGAEQQALQQRQYDIDYQQAMEARNWEKAQLQFFSDLMRGNVGALGQTQVQYLPTPSFGQQALGYGLGALGAYQAFR